MKTIKQLQQTAKKINSMNETIEELKEVYSYKNGDIGAHTIDKALKEAYLAGAAANEAEMREMIESMKKRLPSPTDTIVSMDVYGGDNIEERSKIFGIAMSDYGYNNAVEEIISALNKS